VSPRVLSLHSVARGILHAAQVIALVAAPTWIFQLAASPVAPIALLLCYAVIIVVASARWGTWPTVIGGVASGVAYTWFIHGLGPRPENMPAWGSVTALIMVSVCVSFLSHYMRNKVARVERDQTLRSFSGRVLQLQDEERRRIARELHDSVGQYLTALSIDLSLLENDALRSLTGKKAEDIIHESQRTVQQALVETRTLSYLLHPPLLDETGFATAAQNYINGFSQRSGIRAAVHLPSDLGRLPQTVEVTLFRILQECLTNVHRHSGSRTVTIQLEADAEFLVMEVEDAGKGIPSEFLQCFQGSKSATTVGLAGMRERVKELGGNLMVDSSPGGTVIRVTIPRPDLKQDYSEKRAQSAA
jgi:signal transduction histidine kinase